MQRSRIPRPHVVTRVRALTYTKMALKRLYINGGGRGGARKGEARKRKIRCKYLDIVYSKRAKSDVSDLIIRVTIENESEKKEKFDRTSVMDG